jgi:hypothetical protein
VTKRGLRDSGCRAFLANNQGTPTYSDNNSLFLQKLVIYIYILLMFIIHI